MAAQDPLAALAYDPEISGIAIDSRAVRPGFLFAALPGTATDGRRFIADAVARGAVAVLAPEGTALPPEAGDAVLLTDANPRRRLAFLAAAFHRRQPEVIAAVTGTNGKTSTADFARQMWTAAGRTAASLGTLGIVGPGVSRPGALTTPDPIALHADLAMLAARGIDRLAIEASSHGLDQHRLDGVRVAHAAFTNLTRDHLDYHGTMDAYRAAKLRLFTEVLAPGGTAVLNADSPEFDLLSARARAAGRRVIGYGRAGREIALLADAPHGDGQHLAIAIDGRRHEIDLPLVGGFQAMNALAALGLVLADGVAEATALAGLAGLLGAPGRLQRVARLAGATVYVDYAHTPDALSTALAAVRPHARGRQVCVFGCGGDRDPGKRAGMGAAVARGAEIAIVTDDNPRTEDPSAIRAAAIAGARAAGGAPIEIGDRRAAIGAAMDMLAPGDLLVIAGKGHEAGQTIGDRVLPFEDAAVARALAA
ncbi:MAG: UDP-N-acetylmuramoyl-L-alanyl-D-glutamate--2,6-diaminopimelate ligase, partial [Alphaproteobacteria bacterium]